MTRPPHQSPEQHQPPDPHRPPDQHDPAGQPGTHLQLTLDLHVLNDENFAPGDYTRHASQIRLPLRGRPHTHRHDLRLGGSRTLTIALHCPADPPVDRPADQPAHPYPPTLRVQAIIHETRPAPARARHHACLLLRPGRPAALDLPLHLPGDPHLYAHLTVRCTLIPATADHTSPDHNSPAPAATDPAAHHPTGALHARACRLGWTPAHLQAVPGGYQLTTDHGTLYHDGQRSSALHAHADAHYHARGGPGGPLGLPGGDALTTPDWTVPFAHHLLRGGPDHAALLTRASWTHWPAARAALGAPVADTTRLDRPRGPLDVTPCEHGTLLVDPAQPDRVTPRTLRVPPTRVTRWLQAHLDRAAPGATFGDPWPGPPLRYPLTLAVPGGPLTLAAPGGPLTLCVPLALKVSPAPDARREVHLGARQAGLIDLPPGTPARAARHALRALDDLLRRPLQLAALPAGNHLIGAHVTPDGGLHLDFLPADWT